MDIDQYTRLQPRIVDLQRAALEFAELGQTKVSRHILAAVFTAQKIKPTKPAPADASADAGPASSPKKGKGA